MKEENACIHANFGASSFLFDPNAIEAVLDQRLKKDFEDFGNLLREYESQNQQRSLRSNVSYDGLRDELMDRTFDYDHHTSDPVRSILIPSQKSSANEQGMQHALDRRDQPMLAILNDKNTIYPPLEKAMEDFMPPVPGGFPVDTRGEPSTSRANDYMSYQADRKWETAPGVFGGSTSAAMNADFAAKDLKGGLESAVRQFSSMIDQANRRQAQMFALMEAYKDSQGDGSLHSNSKESQQAQARARYYQQVAESQRKLDPDMKLPKTQ